jgi:large subunit ribosomal protein L6
MSRVAKNPVKLPAGVEVKLAGQQLSIKGAKGTLELNVHSSVEIIQEAGELRFAARNGDQQNRAMAGTTRALVNNMVIGVSQGFERKLQLVGVGYKAQAKGQVLNLALGFSHPIDYELPQGVTAETPSQIDILIKASTSIWSVRWLRRSATSVVLSRTKAKACVIPTKSYVAKKLRRSRA